MNNNEHISRIVDISRFDPNKTLLHVTASGIRFIQNGWAKQRNTGMLTVIVKDKSALMSTRDTKLTKYFYDDLQGIGKSKSLFKQLKSFQELDYWEKITMKRSHEINVTPY